MGHRRKYGGYAGNSSRGGISTVKSPSEVPVQRRKGAYPVRVPAHLHFQRPGPIHVGNIGRWVNISEGDMFMLFPGEWHSYRPDPRTGWKEYWIGFNGHFIEAQEENGFFTRDRAVMHVGIHSKMSELYENAIKAAAEQKASFQPLLGSLVMHMLGLGYFYARQEGFTEVEERIDRAKMIIMENLSTITPEEIASDLCMGYSNFRRIFKQYTGFSPAKYIIQMRINRILEALTNSHDPIKQIAFENGFDNYDYFFTVFRRITGTTPGEYRAVTQRGGVKP